MVNIFAMTLLFVLLSASAFAHYPWITLHKGDGRSADQRFELGWGHDFPHDGILSADRVDSLSLVKPGGDTLELAVKEDGIHTIDNLDTPGGYIVAAVQKGGYYTRTTRGGRQGSKADHLNAISCGFSNNTMKSIFSKGGKSVSFDHVLGHALEIVPLADPAALGKGDRFSIKVLFHGKPFTGTVNATWEGFEGDDGYAVESASNKDGIAEIPLESDGLWMIMVHTSEAYPDTEVCDNLNYTSTLTFRIK